MPPCKRAHLLLDLADQFVGEPRGPGPCRSVEAAAARPGHVVRGLVQLMVAGILLLVAVTTPVMGFAAAEHYEGRRFYGAFEGDWFLLLALVAGGVCLWQAVSLIRLALTRR
jgi:hypothetical protein